MSRAGLIGIALHVVLLAWLAPIAFFDGGRVASDWVETLVPFGALSAPLIIAVIGNSTKGFGFAALSGLMITVFFFLTVSAGALMLVPTVLYAWAGLPTKEAP